ncbi:TadE/TadG family type IV pilus assembly protein [Embleya sp. NBC_00896]|uniref:TadE/TadG family type IV pilus assembly protein n=1 Tax=Embleya sp. NBC_00896 TaxID=2975961 RepID=UPI00386A63B9|nr:pilus assembly protein [Embleya sp. NBC_00896]
MSISLAIVFPVFMLMLMTVIQGCLWWYAREAAMHAAKEGVEAGRVTGGNQQAGDTRAREVATDLGGGVLRDLAVTTSVTTADGTQIPVRIRVEVKGTSLSILPGLPAFTVVQRASGSMERWTTPNR